MTEGYPKRLIEVDLPIKRISAHARKEKSVRHGHISSIHMWWARRPLAACRAVTCAALWPDPADPKCPQAFLDSAKKSMAAWSRQHLDLVSEESWPNFIAIQKDSGALDDHQKLRTCLLDFITDFSDWNNSTNEKYLEYARELTKVAHESLGGNPGTRPLVIDPFSGGGAIPLEALRVGADAFASDLNPVAVLLNKVMLEYVPRFGSRLTNAVRNWGAWVYDNAEKDLSSLYAKDSEDLTPVAYLWARILKCQGPACGAEIPLLNQLVISKRRSVAAELSIEKGQVDIKIITGGKTQGAAAGTVKNGSVTCPVCG